MKKRFFKKKPYTKKPETKNVSNAKYLVIVESPSKCSKIEEYLGADYACIASLGHIRHIKGLKSINAKLNYEITFDFIKEKEYHINQMRDIIKKNGGEVWYMVAMDEGHGFRKKFNRDYYMNAVSLFFKEHLIK